MKTLRAIVTESNGKTQHGLGRIGVRGPEVEKILAVPATVEIQAEKSGFLLLRFDSSGQFSGDTWHQTLEEAKEQARVEFNISDSDWEMKT